MNEQVGLVLTTTNLQMCSAEPNFAQLREVERAGANSVVKESHFSGGSAGTEVNEKWPASSFTDLLTYIVNISQAE